MEFYIRSNADKSKFNNHWQFCVGSGHASMALRADYLKQLKQVHDELGIERVRFHGIFNDDMQVYMQFSDLMPLPGAEKIKQISFRKIGMVYDNILACGMKPYVEMSFMPKGLASSDARCGLFYGGHIAPPDNEEEWVSFVQMFVRYLLNKFGREEVESWPFEVWNEPDVFVFWAGTKVQYYRLYEITAKAIKSVDEKIQVGGPAASGSKWIGSFMEYCKANNVPVDFISSHQYAGDPIGGVNASEELEAEENIEAMELASGSESGKNLFEGLEEGTILDGIRRIMPDKSELVEIPNDGFRKNAAIVRKQAGDLPVYYSEWNENAIFSSYTNDTRKVAAYLVKTILDTECNVTGSSIWCFSDIFEEFSEIAQEFHGGFGLMTHSGIPKPQYYALKMMSSLAENRLNLGEQSIDGEVGLAAFKDEKKVQVLLFRQKMKNIELPKEKVVFKVETGNEPSHVYMERIDEKHCNPLALWEEWGSPEELSHEQLAEIVEATKIKAESMHYSYDNGCVNGTVELGVNDIYLITICLD